MLLVIILSIIPFVSFCKSPGTVPVLVWTTCLLSDSPPIQHGPRQWPPWKIVILYQPGVSRLSGSMLVFKGDVSSHPVSVPNMLRTSGSELTGAGFGIVDLKDPRHEKHTHHGPSWQYSVLSNVWFWNNCLPTSSVRDLLGVPSDPKPRGSS